uniref:Uncharacterized protein n=1 Tax=Anguilla anguilla TaxID=7936 RepID=A0A0E9TLS0_ANGAN
MIHHLYCRGNSNCCVMICPKVAGLRV